MVAINFLVGEVECIDQTTDEMVVSFPSDCIRCNLLIVVWQCWTLEIIVKVVMVLKTEWSQAVIVSSPFFSLMLFSVLIVVSIWYADSFPVVTDVHLQPVLQTETPKKSESEGSSVLWTSQPLQEEELPKLRYLYIQVRSLASRGQKACSYHWSSALASCLGGR